MTFNNVRDALATKSVELRRGYIETKQAFILERNGEMQFLLVSEYDLIDVLHVGLRLN